jgi:hypothetical protein
MTMTTTKIDSSHESGKNFIITWAWPASTTIIYNNPVVAKLVPAILKNYCSLESLTIKKININSKKRKLLK